MSIAAAFMEFIYLSELTNRIILNCISYLKK